MVRSAVVLRTMPTAQNRDMGHPGPTAVRSGTPHVIDDKAVANMGHPLCYGLRFLVSWMVPILMSDCLQDLSRQKPVIQTSPSPIMAPWELTKRFSYFCLKMASWMSWVMMRS